MAKSFDYQAAKSAGYTDDEITSFLGENNPTFDVNAARNAGYSPDEINGFLSQNKPKQGGVRGHLERKVAGPAVELGLRAATAIPATAKGVSGLVNKGINSLVQSLGAKGLSDEELDQVGKFASAIGPFGNMPEKSDIDKILKQVTGNRLEPTTPGERMLKSGAGLVGDVVGFPGGAGAAFGTPARVAGTAALVGTTAGLEESGLHPLLALGGGIAADLLTRGAGSLGKRIVRGVQKGIPQTAGTLAGRVARLSPDQVRTEVVAAGDRLGIPQGEIPLSAQLSSPAVQGVETKLRESSLAGRHLEKQLGNVENKTRTAFEDIANQISTRQGLLPGAVAEEAITQLKNIEQHATDTYSSLYGQAEKLLPDVAVIEQGIGRTIMRTVDDLVVKLGRGAGTPAKDTLRTRLTRLANDWKQRFPNGEIGVKDVIELKKDLNQIIKYEVKGGVDKLLNPLNHLTRNAVQRYGKTNQPFAFRFNEAERHFADSAKKFRKNKAVESLLNTQNPQQILQKMRNVKTYRELRDLFNRTPEGKQAFQDLSRYLLEDIIGSKLLDKNKKVSWGNASGMLKDPKIREIVQEIVGPENFNKLKDISKISSGIEEGLRKFANPAGSATKAADIALWLGTIGKGLGQIFSGRIIQGAKTMSYILLPRVMASLMANPKFIQSMVDVAHAGRGTNPTLFLEAAERAARFIIPAVAESYSAEPEENESKGG